MSEKVTPNPNQAQTHDAQLAAENMAADKENAQTVDVEADYEASKAFSVSEVDRTSKGAQEAAEATAPHFKVSQPKETVHKAEATGNPSDYLDMARDVNPQSEATGNITDETVQKALEKGQAGK